MCCLFILPFINATSVVFFFFMLMLMLMLMLMHFYFLLFCLIAHFLYRIDFAFEIFRRLYLKLQKYNGSIEIQLLIIMNHFLVPRNYMKLKFLKFLDNQIYYQNMKNTYFWTFAKFSIKFWQWNDSNQVKSHGLISWGHRILISNLS